MSEIKIYRIIGKMLISHDHLPEERIFRLEVPAAKEEDAIERVYSELGSRHKVKRSHIKILEVREVSPSEALSPYVKKMLSLGALRVE